MIRVEAEKSISFREGCFLSFKNRRQCFALQWDASEALNLREDVPAGAPWEEVKLLGFGQSFEDALSQLQQISATKIVAKKMMESQVVEVVFSPAQGRVRVAGRSFVRAMVIDDSKTIRKLLTNILTRDPGIEVVATVERPSEALEQIQRFRPDVITLDIHMPEMNGVELLKKYISRFPIPTVMISSISKEEGTFVFDALGAGAIDYIQKPTMEDLDSTAPVITEKVRLAAKAKILSSSAPAKAVSLVDGKAMDLSKLVVIGSSTGGTEALKEVLTRMPEKIPPVLIVQHIPPVFSAALAQRLNSLCPFTVKEAQDGDVLEPGTVYIAPGAKQMKLKKKKDESLVLEINEDPPVNRHRPSVDYLFDSVAKLGLKPGVGVILTGMGADGARGLLQLKEKGWHTIAQNEESCVVYGMPKEAVKLGAAVEILELTRIAEAIVRGGKSRGLAA